MARIAKIMGWHVDESLQGDTGIDLSKNTNIKVIQ